MSRRHVHPIAFAPLEVLLQQKASCGETFTVCELRDRLSKQPDLADISSKRLRLYVRDQINTREKHGIVEQVGVEGKCRKIFRLTTPGNEEGSSFHAIAGNAHDTTSLAEQLNRDSEQLRAQMEESDLQLQVLQEIVEKYPDAWNEIVPLFEEEKTQAQSLGAKLKAYAKVQQKLAEARGDG